MARCGLRGAILDLNYGPVAWGAMEACDWRPSRANHEQRDLLYINTGRHEGLEGQLYRYLRAGYLKKMAFDYNGQKWSEVTWDVQEVLSEAKRVAAVASGLVHTRDAGL